jgi:hypothetical protein
VHSGALNIVRYHPGGRHALVFVINVEHELLIDSVCILNDGVDAVVLILLEVKAVEVLSDRIDRGIDLGL